MSVGTGRPRAALGQSLAAHFRQFAELDEPHASWRRLVSRRVARRVFAECMSVWSRPTHGGTARPVLGREGAEMSSAGPEMSSAGPAQQLSRAKK